jgi:DNA-binding MarR family transcriptional regulator
MIGKQVISATGLSEIPLSIFIKNKQQEFSIDTPGHNILHVVTTTYPGIRTMKKFSYDDSLSFLFNRVHNLGMAMLRRDLQQKDHDVTPEQLNLMFRIQERGGINQKQLGEISFKDRPNITRILRLLKKKGFVETRPDEGNRKANLLFLTRSGKEVLGKSASVILKNWDNRYSGLSPEEDRILRRILKHIIGNIENQLYKS